MSQKTGIHNWIVLNLPPDAKVIAELPVLIALLLLSAPIPLLVYMAKLKPCKVQWISKLLQKNILLEWKAYKKNQNAYFA